MEQQLYSVTVDSESGVEIHNYLFDSPGEVSADFWDRVAMLYLQVERCDPTEGDVFLSHLRDKDEGFWAKVMDGTVDGRRKGVACILGVTFIFATWVEEYPFTIQVYGLHTLGE